MVGSPCEPSVAVGTGVVEVADKRVELERFEEVGREKVDIVDAVKELEEALRVRLLTGTLPFWEEGAGETPGLVDVGFVGKTTVSVMVVKTTDILISTIV